MNLETAEYILGPNFTQAIRTIIEHHFEEGDKPKSKITDALAQQSSDADC
jgi:hypothetical protein